MPDLDALARAVRLVIFDVDGVFTDGRLFYSPEGEEIKVFHVRDGVGVKALAAAGVRPDEVAFLGDDLPDLPVMAEVGLAACPADAHDAVKRACHWVGSKKGGRGAVREFCDFLIDARVPAGGGGS